jgi:hypothetical protein
MAGLVLAGCGTDVSGPSAALFSCVFTEPQSLAVGEVVRFGGSGNGPVCLTTSDSEALFAYIPFLAAEGSTGPDASPLLLAVDLLGGGVAPADFLAALAPGPAASTLPASQPELRPDHEFHRRLREREILELEPKIRRAPAGGPAVTLAPPVASSSLAQVGDVVAYNVALSCGHQDMRTGRVVRVSQHSIVVADVDNPAGFTTQDYADLAAAMDTLVHPMVIRYFGAPTDIDGNGRVIIFLTRAVNQRSTPGGGITIGMFWSGDLFPWVATDRLEACPAGNRAEIFYVAVPDPLGTAGPSVTASWLRERMIAVLGHEYQHLVNAARRMYVNEAPTFERVWLNEGLSHIAEELLFFEASRLPRRSNITMAMLESASGGLTAFGRYMDGNIRNLTLYLQQPGSESPMGLDDLATRGATWSFLRYAVDRSGVGDEGFFRELVDTRAAGLGNLDQVVGGSALDWMQDWSVALYADDHVPRLLLRYTQPTWHFRDIFARHPDYGKVYPLAPVPLTPGVPRPLHLEPGGAGHLTFGVRSEERATVHVSAGESNPPRTLRGAFLRVR